MFLVCISFIFHDIPKKEIQNPNRITDHKIKNLRRRPFFLKNSIVFMSKGYQDYQENHDK